MHYGSDEFIDLVISTPEHLRVPLVLDAVRMKYGNLSEVDCNDTAALFVESCRRVGCVELQLRKRFECLALRRADEIAQMVREHEDEYLTWECERHLIDVLRADEDMVRDRGL